MNRRDFLRTAGGAAGGTVAASAGAVGPAVAADGGGGEGGEEGGGGNQTDGGGGGGGQPDFGGYLDGANNFDGSVADLRGESEPTVEVGAGSDGLAFGPAAVHVDSGATVVWEWTGEGGTHNVVHQDGEFGSELSGESGFTYEYAFDEDGIYNYYCEPHRGQGMLGSVVVGSDYPSIAAGARTEQEPHDMGVPFQPHFVGIATLLAMMMTLVFTFFTLKYGESPHTKGGNN